MHSTYIDKFWNRIKACQHLCVNDKYSNLHTLRLLIDCFGFYAVSAIFKQCNSGTRIAKGILYVIWYF